MLFPGDFASSPRTALAGATVPLPQASRCFHTAADGRIALTNDWAALLRETARLDAFALQTRHALARLVAIVRPAELRAGPVRASWHDDTGAVRFLVPRWQSASGYLRQCACCQSPGRVEIFNRAGGEFMQICALPDSALLPWAEFLGAVLPARGARAAGNRAAPAAGAMPFELPRFAQASVRFPFELRGLFALLEAFGDARLPIRCVLRSSDICHHRDFVPSQVGLDGAVLGLGEAGCRLQLVLPAIDEVAFTSDTSGPALHFLTEDDRVILSLAAAGPAPAAQAWRDALHRAFPRGP